MNNWTKLEKDLSDWLETFESTKIQYRNPYQAIAGFPSNGFRSDGMLTDGNTLVAIEVEAAQTHPDTNVGKYWLLNQIRPYKKIILFHIYTPRFNSYPWRKHLAEFYLDKMHPEVPIDYILLDYRNATDYDAVLKKTKTTIKQRLQQEFAL